MLVLQNRRRLSDRRGEKYDFGDLDDKVFYLKNAVYKAPLQYALNKHDSVVISRVLDVITIGELTFLLDHHGTGNIFHSSESEDCINADMSTSNGERVIGLMNLGLLSRSAKGQSSNSVVVYNFTPLADKLVKLFTKQNN
jgi:hypothetical protein